MLDTLYPRIQRRPLVATSKADALTPADLTRAVHDNLRNLSVDALDVVNLWLFGTDRELDRGTGCNPR
jgi:hypothetical protein